jgi:hypothetical protein
MVYPVSLLIIVKPTCNSCKQFVKIDCLFVEEMKESTAPSVLPPEQEV